MDAVAVWESYIGRENQLETPFFEIDVFDEAVTNEFVIWKVLDVMDCVTIWLHFLADFQKCHYLTVQRLKQINLILYRILDSQNSFFHFIVVKVWPLSHRSMLRNIEAIKTQKHTFLVHEVETLRFNPIFPQTQFLLVNGVLISKTLHKPPVPIDLAFGINCLKLFILDLKNLEFVVLRPNFIIKLVWCFFLHIHNSIWLYNF